MTNTANTVQLLKCVSKCSFRPFSQQDFYAFADADGDAQMGEAGTFELDNAMSALTGARVDNCIVVVSGNRIEIHGNQGGDPVAASLDLTPNAL